MNPSSTSPVPSPRPRRHRLRWLLLGILLLGVGAAWWHYRRSEQPPVPPMPEGIQEQEVLQSVTRHREAVLAAPKSADAWGEYALILLAQLFDRDADFCFAEASRLAPRDPQWLFGRAQIALKRDPEQALVLLRDTIAVAPPGSEYHVAARFSLAEALLERGELDPAVKLLTEELGPPPGNPRALFDLGLAAVARGDTATAYRYLSAVRKDPHARKQTTAFLARLAREQGDEKSARRFEREATEAEADLAWPDPLHDRTAVLAVGRRGRDRKIAALERTGRYDEVVQEHLARLEIDRNPEDLMGAGVNLMRLREYDRAFPLLREAAERAPTNPRAHYTLALALFTRTERELDQDPGSIRAKEWLREAAEHARKSTELKRDHAKAYLFWGLSLKLLGDPKGAIEPLRQGLVARPDEFELHLALGQVLAATGDKEGAEKSFHNAQQLNPDDPRPARELESLKQKK